MSPMERDKRQISESSDPETALTFSRKLLGELAVPQRSQKQRLSLCALQQEAGSMQTKGDVIVWLAQNFCSLKAEPGDCVVIMCGAS